MKTSGQTLIDPEVLGLPSTTGQGERTLAKARNRLQDALIAGDAAVCRQVVLDLYLAHHRISVICDDVLAVAFEQIGERWNCGDVEVYEERRSCEICLRILYELRSAQPPIPDQAPVAIGGTLEGDHYVLPTAMAELVLRENGWRAASLGNSLPVATLKSAVERTHPKVLWLSVSHIPDEDRFVEAVSELYEKAAAAGAALAVGGRELIDDIRKQIQYSAFCDTMQHLESFAATLHSPA